jgi:galactarate dehydratase
MNQPLKPLTIKVHPTDNVAIVVNSGGLHAGTVFNDGLTLREHVPQGHKVALVEIALDAPILRYGEVIGYAMKPIPQGSWIEESLVRLPEAPPLESLPLATKVPAPLPPLEGYTFEGYRNADGTVGTKNLLAITQTVQCVAGVVDYVVRRLKAEVLPKYPNVDGIIGLNHIYGCGVAINAPAAVVPIRTLHNLALNPNFGNEVFVISLGCEKLPPERLLNEGGIPIKVVSDDVVCLQDERFTGFQSMVEAIMKQAEVHLVRLNQRQRETCPAADLIVGLQCGGSDAFSGVTANPAVGYAADLLVRAGAAVMFSEVTEVRDAIHLLTPRCANEEVGKALLREMAWYDDYLDCGETNRAANTTPGNKKGGLANIVEKAMGSIAKSGTSAIVDVIAPGEKIRRKGLTYAATPASDFVCGTQQLASGMTLQVFTTGRGTPYGLEAAPVIKVATRRDLAARWYDLMEVDAGTIATGEATIEEVGWEIFRLILDVASGRKKTWADQWGLFNSLAVFNPAPVT